MARTIVIPGHLIDAKTVQLDSPAPADASEAEVLIRVTDQTAKPSRKLSEILRRLPPGTRSKAELDQQIEEERDAWER